MMTYDAATRKFVWSNLQALTALDSVTKISVTNNLQALTALDSAIKSSVTNNLQALTALDSAIKSSVTGDLYALTAFDAITEGIAARNRAGIAAIAEGIAASCQVGLNALANGIGAQLAAFDAFRATPRYLGRITEIVAAWPGPLDRLREVVDLVEELAAEEATPAEVSAAVSTEFPLLDGLIGLLPDDKAQWYGFIALLLTALQVALALRSGQVEPHPNVPRVVVNCNGGSARVLVQSDQPSTPNPVTVNCEVGGRVSYGAR